MYNGDKTLIHSNTNYKYIFCYSLSYFIMKSKYISNKILWLDVQIN